MSVYGRCLPTEVGCTLDFFKIYCIQSLPPEFRLLKFYFINSVHTVEAFNHPIKLLSLP